MHIPFPIINSLLGIVGVALGGLIAKALHTPQDHDRALLLEKIADGAAALVVSMNPRAQWADLLKQVIKAIEAAAGLPTDNAAAIERAAAASLARLGKVQA